MSVARGRVRTGCRPDSQHCSLNIRTLGRRSTLPKTRWVARGQHSRSPHTGIKRFTTSEPYEVRLKKLLAKPRTLQPPLCISFTVFLVDGMLPIRITNPPTPMKTFTLKLETLYAAYSPELGMVSYGHCQDEALNNLSEDIREQQTTRVATGYKRK
jgi:hypothetical protein